MSGEGHGYLGRDKSASGNQPGHTGKLTIDGVEYKLAAWIKQGKYGRYFSLKAQRVEPKPPPEPEPADMPDDLNDEIPF